MSKMLDDNKAMKKSRPLIIVLRNNTTLPLENTRHFRDALPPVLGSAF
jgi:hypothetical protein